MTLTAERIAFKGSNGANGNGHANGNGNGMSWRRNFAAESAGLLVAEFASMIVSVGAFAFLGETAPNTMKKVSKVLGKCLEPYLDTIEWGMQTTCKLKECQPDFTKSREERAQHYAHYMTLFGVSLAAGIATEILVRKVANNAFGVLPPTPDKSKTIWQKCKPSKHDLAVVGIDKGVQFGAILGVNTIFAKQADAGIDGISTFLQKTLGWPEDRAKKAAEMLVVYEGPNWLGYLAASGYIGHHHYKKSLVEKLALKADVSPHFSLAT